jgi:hypothetical protein
LVNRRAKGLRTNAKAAKEGRRRGYRVHVFSHTRWQKDAFGVADQVWLSKGGDVVWVQVKTNKWGNVAPLLEFSRAHLQWVKLLMWKDRSGWLERNFYRGREIPQEGPE